MEKSVGSDANAEAEKPSVPPFPYNNSAGLAVANANKPMAQFTETPEVILDRLRAGESVPELAKSIGVNHSHVYEWLLRHCPDEWTAISAAKSLHRIQKAEEDMDAADDQVKVAKARESHRMGAWTLERVARRLYGDNKTEGGGVTINVTLDRSCDGLTIEGQSA